MDLLFTTWNTSGHQSCVPTRAYFSSHHLVIWLSYMVTSQHQSEAKKAVSTESSVSDISHFTTQKPQVNPYTVFKHSIALKQFHWGREFLMLDLQQLHNIPVVGVIQGGGTECISNTHTQARRQMSVSQSAEGSSSGFSSSTSPLQIRTYWKCFSPWGMCICWGVNICTNSHFCEYIIFLLQLKLPECLSISSALLSVRSPWTNSPWISVTADCPVLCLAKCGPF